MGRLVLLTFVGITIAGLASPASATLLGQTIDPIFDLGSITGSVGTENEGTQTVTATGAHYGEGVQDGSNIDVSATQIVITDDLPPSMPFCSTANPCHDSFTGFDFKFSAGANIAGVTVDPTSSATFLPNSGGTPAGLSLTSSSEFTVNLAGDAPAIGDKLVLDLTFRSVATVPEPGSLMVLLAGMAGLAGVRLRQRSRS